MDCDIHAHVEIKIKGQWHYFSLAKLGRNYQAFSLMAGVRQYDGFPEPLALPRGLPDDVTFMTKLHSDYYGVDGHSHSWLSFDEMCQVADFISQGEPLGWRKPPDFNVWLFGYYLTGWKEHQNGNDGYYFPDGMEDIRLVFWFDNQEAI